MTLCFFIEYLLIYEAKKEKEYWVLPSALFLYVSTHPVSLMRIAVRQ
nr:MAG TPA: hypothetical protein [Caudoviricetes sp.]